MWQPLPRQREVIHTAPWATVFTIYNSSLSLPFLYTSSFFIFFLNWYVLFTGPHRLPSLFQQRFFPRLKRLQIILKYFFFSIFKYNAKSKYRHAYTHTHTHTYTHNTLLLLGQIALFQLLFFSQEIILYSLLPTLSVINVHTLPPSFISQKLGLT